MYEVLNRTNCKRNAQLRTLRCVAWLVTAATQRNAQQCSTSNATQRNAQRSECGHGPLCSSTRWLLHWPLMGRLLHLLQRGTASAGWGPAQSPHRCTKCNSPPINGQYLRWHYNCLWSLNSKGLKIAIETASLKPKALFQFRIVRRVRANNYKMIMHPRQLCFISRWRTLIRYWRRKQTFNNSTSRNSLLSNTLDIKRHGPITAVKLTSQHNYVGMPELHYVQSHESWNTASSRRINS